MRPLHAGRRISLPRIADRSVLDQVAAEIQGAPASVEFVLDLQATLHLDYRALRRMVKRLRARRTGSTPILLSGLSPYLTEIFRFTLEGRDWDLFEDHRPAQEPWGQGEYLPSRFYRRGRDRFVRVGPRFPFRPGDPCPN